MAQNCECRVSLDEIADRAGVNNFAPMAESAEGRKPPVLRRAEALRLDVRADWAGRPSVSVADAARLYAAVTGAADEANRANAARISAEDDETRRRDKAAQNVYQEAYDGAIRRGVPAPQAAERAAHARTEYLEDEHPGFIARIKQAVSR